ncbi:unnamed protein product [Alopecurus aequalis]
MESMDPLLLAASFWGSCRALRSVLDGEATLVLQDGVPTRAFLELLKHGVTADVTSRRASSAVSLSLLEGVTTEGDTALHVVATNGNGDSHKQCANFIHGKARHLLYKVNNNGDTPIHCAARAGRSCMVSHLLALARSDDDGAGERLKELLRTENQYKETALHEAVRIGSDRIVGLLMEADSELACFPKDGGTSPLYLAALHDLADIAHILHKKSGGYLSYTGPDGQNALHAAALRSQVMAKMLLEWNVGLTEQKDRNGSTPLHFATSILHPRGVHYMIFRPWNDWFHNFWHSTLPFLPVPQVIFHRLFPWNRGIWHSGTPFDPLLQANLTPIYQSDDLGIFPIHIAASTGVNKAIVKILEKCPYIASVRDIKGRTFLHVAVEKKKWNIVALASQTPSLSWILNMQDKEGDTALHKSIKFGHQDIFASLLENQEVRLNITNWKGETPLDLSQSKIHVGCFLAWNPRFVMNAALIYCHAKHGNRRLDHFEEQYMQAEDEENESNKLTASSQTLGVGTALMTTVAFAATFTPPGDYSNNGTPNLSRRYVFEAFIAANSLAFACSGLATINLMYSGKAMVDVPLRCLHIDIVVVFAVCGVTSLATAFVLSLYVMLDPVAHMTSTVVCVVASLMCVCGFIDPLRGLFVARALFRRLGNPAWMIFARILIIQTTMVFWPLVVSFIWAEISGKDRHKNLT